MLLKPWSNLIGLLPEIELNFYLKNLKLAKIGMM